MPPGGVKCGICGDPWSDLVGRGLVPRRGDQDYFPLRASDTHLIWLRLGFSAIGDYARERPGPSAGKHQRPGLESHCD